MMPPIEFLGLQTQIQVSALFLKCNLVTYSKFREKAYQEK